MGKRLEEGFRMLSENHRKEFRLLSGRINETIVGRSDTTTLLGQQLLRHATKVKPTSEWRAARGDSGGYSPGC